MYLTDTFSLIILQQNDKRNVFFVIKLTYIKIPRKLVTKQNEWWLRKMIKETLQLRRHFLYREVVVLLFKVQ